MHVYVHEQGKRHSSLWRVTRSVAVVSCINYICVNCNLLIERYPHSIFISISMTDWLTDRLTTCWISDGLTVYRLINLIDPDLSGRQVEYIGQYPSKFKAPICEHMLYVYSEAHRRTQSFVCPKADRRSSAGRCSYFSLSQKLADGPNPADIFC